MVDENRIVIVPFLCSGRYDVAGLGVSMGMGITMAHVNLREFDASLDVMQVIPKCYGWTDENVQLKVLAHGLLQNAHTHWIKVAREFYQKSGYNVIIVDWSKYAATISEYYKSARYALHVGRMLGPILVKIFRDGYAKPENIELIGHSLGCHIMAVLGQSFSLTTKKLIGQITAMDPAHLFFEEDRPTLERLDKDDAACVYVIHTDAGHPLDMNNFGFGLNYTAGTADFWINGGRDQKACDDFLEIGYRNLYGCSHSMAPMYFISVLKGIMGPGKLADWRNCSVKGNITSPFTLTPSEELRIRNARRKLC